MINESQPEATTSNYFQVAVSDDQSAINEVDNQETTQSVSQSKADKAEIRRQRIEAAVERSKTEYKAEHAYTERGWFTNPETERNVLSKNKVDKQHLEYITTNLYYSEPPNYEEALRLILDSFDPKAKHSGGLPRELLDTGLRCSLKCNDIENAINLADSSKVLWKGQFAGIAALASDAYLIANRPKDALSPLFISTSFFGLHEPILSRLSKILKQIISSSSLSSSSSNANHGYQQTKHFLNILEKVVIWKSNYLQKPLFNDQPDASSSRSSESVNTNRHGDENGNENIPKDTNIDISFDKPINLQSIIEELEIIDEETINGLKGTVNRLNKGSKNEPEVIEKSVREL
ncbi:uncharacterized protein L201_000303 [Kwoniella dendrophila CBS 6074]|uniref:Uncharacterized protein n=1 Tax=Kwoniella dendrophila CBS 6074 TaxID=1295534 RepID=A0AAX4JLH2_9TREE